MLVDAGSPLVTAGCGNGSAAGGATIAATATAFGAGELRCGCQATAKARKLKAATPATPSPAKSALCPRDSRTRAVVSAEASFSSDTGTMLGGAETRAACPGGGGGSLGAVPLALASSRSTQLGSLDESAARST